MKKFKLDVSQLRVESFDAAPSMGAGARTVRGQTMYTCDTGIGGYCTEGVACPGDTQNECLTAHCDDTNAAGTCPTYDGAPACSLSATACNSWQTCME